MCGSVSMIDGHSDNDSAKILFLERSLAMARGEKAVIENRIAALETALKKAREKK